MSAFDPKRTTAAPGLQLLTGPLQMWMDTDRYIVATLGDFRRDYECSEEPTPRTKKFGQDPECSCNDACKQCKHRTKRYEI
jgi:hypothetical protein